MKVACAVNYFGSKTNLAKALGIKKQTISSWKNLVPLKHAAVLYFATSGKLHLDIKEYGYYIKDI